MTPFTDPSSRNQVAIYRLYENHAARLHNLRAVAHWNDECRSLWEIEHLKPAVRIEDHPDVLVRHSLPDDGKWRWARASD